MPKREQKRNEWGTGKQNKYPKIHLSIKTLFMELP